jgi:iron complex transport system substrate-binding protein
MIIVIIQYVGFKKNTYKVVIIVKKKATKTLWTSLSILSISALLLAGCGAAKPAGTEGTTQPTAISGGTSSKAAAERTVQSAMGEVKVPGAPKKIATLVGNHADHLLTLGITPHATDAGDGNSFKDKIYLKETLSKAIPLGNTWTPNLEAILSAEPDLIISNKGVHEKAYGDLSKIAPTVLLAVPETDWRKEFLEIASIVDKVELGNQKLADYDKHAAEVKAKLKPVVGDQTVLFLRVLAKEIRVYGGISPQGEILYKDLGLKAAPNIPMDKHAEPIAMEKLPEINPDILFLMDDSGDVIKDFVANPLWKQLDAVKNGKVYAAGKDVWPWGGLIARNTVLDYLAKTLAVK